MFDFKNESIVVRILDSMLIVQWPVCQPGDCRWGRAECLPGPQEAADIMAEAPNALQLRYLQTLNAISAERNSTIIFPLPIDLLSSMMK